MKTWQWAIGAGMLALAFGGEGLLVGEGSVYAEEDAAHRQAISSEADHSVAHPHGQAAKSDPPSPMTFDPDLAIFSAIVFLLLLGILGKFAWPAIVTALEEREQSIADNISSASAKHEEAKQLLSEHEAKLALASGEVRELLEEARRDAEHTKSQIVDEAKKIGRAHV